MRYSIFTLSKNDALKIMEHKARFSPTMEKQGCGFVIYWNTNKG